MGRLILVLTGSVLLTGIGGFLAQSVGVGGVIALVVIVLAGLIVLGRSRRLL